MKLAAYFAQQIDHTAVGIPQVAADPTAIDAILDRTFIVIGAIAVLFVVIGGFRYVVSGGDSSKTKLAKDTILYVGVGIIVTLTAFVIVQVVLGVIYG